MKSTVFVVLSIVSLVLALAAPDASGQAVTVTPANPTIAVGQTQQFTATGIATAVSYDAGAFHSCALIQDGSVRCWGQNALGQLGNGTTTNSTTPVAVVGIIGATAVSGGGYHSCALLPDGTIECWGRNDSGQLGRTTPTEAVTTPDQVSGITTATAVSAGAFHTCALLQNGSVSCWGLNSAGQLGNGSLLNSTTPVTVTGITNAVGLSAGGWHTCARLADGTLRCWGENLYGALGNGTTVNSPTPVTPTGLTNVVVLDAGIFHTCAIVQGGAVRCWGRNGDGRLGTGSTDQANTPTPVNGITAVGLAPGAEHSCAILTDFTMRCWGDNNWGQLGNGAPAGSISTSPAPPVTGITGAVVASAGAEHTCVALQDGSVRCWGRNGEGRHGDGTTNDAFTPVRATGLGGTWTSSNTNVATINGAGLATGVAPGSVTITASSGNQSGSTTLTVANANRPTLAVVREGTGTGSVTSNPAGINCGSQCSASYNQGTQVTLTATPANGSSFEGWTGGGCAGTGTCTLTLTANTTVTARFGSPRVTLSVTRTGNGTVTSTPAGINCGTTCSASYNPGTQVTLTATPVNGSTFEGWTGGGCSGTGACTVTLNANTTVTARFGATPPARFTLSVSRTGNGTVTSTPAGINCGSTCSASYNAGSQVTLTATAANGSTFEGWTGGGCSGTGACTITLTANTTVTARFGVPRFTLTTNVAGTLGLGSGTITSNPGGISCRPTCSATYEHGTVVTLTARPGFLSVFVGWSGGCSGILNNTCTVTIRENTSVTATFAGL